MIYFGGGADVGARGFGVSIVGCGMWGVRFKVQGLGFGSLGVGLCLRVQYSELRVHMFLEVVTTKVGVQGLEVWEVQEVQR